MSERLTAVLVIEFPEGMSPEGVNHGLRPVHAAIEYAAGEVTGETLGYGDPDEAALRVVTAFWETGQSLPLQMFTCPCGLRADLATVVAHTGTCPEWAARA